MEQQSRDLRERLNARKNHESALSPCCGLRSRSRSTDGKSRSRQTDEYVGPWDRSRDKPRRRDCSQSSWPRSRTNSEPSVGVASDTSSASETKRSKRTPFVKETDPVILARRQKQLDYGKNTLVYQQYIQTIPKHEREPFHPRTPVKLRHTSRRRWDSAIKNWRIHLHYWNDPVKLAQLRSKDADSVTSDRTASSTPEPKPDVDAALETPLAKTEKISEVSATAGPVSVKHQADDKWSVKVKQEPDDSDHAEWEQGAGPALSPLRQTHGADSVKVKQEPEEEQVSPTRLPAAASVVLKQEPNADCTSSPEVAGHSPRSCEGETKLERSQYLEEFEDNADADWADDLEGLASELAC